MNLPLCRCNPALERDSRDGPRLPSGPNPCGHQRAKESRTWTLWARAPSAGVGPARGKGAWGIRNLPRVLRGYLQQLHVLLLSCLETAGLPPPPSPPPSPPSIGSGIWAQQRSPMPALGQLEGLGRWLLTGGGCLGLHQPKTGTGMSRFPSSQEPPPMAAP